VRLTIFPSISAPTTLQPKIIFWVLACSRQPSKARAIERLGRNPCRIKGAGVDPTPERPVIGVEAVLALADATAATLTPIAGDPDLAALDKLLHFSALARWRAQRRDLLVSLARMWCSDDNAVLRQKLRPGIADRIAPLLADIIGQGVQEGVFTAAYPDQMGCVIVSLIQDLNDRLAELLLAAEPGQRTLRTAEHTIAAYTDALERILGVPAGSVVLIKTQTQGPWFDPERI
jgi:hypothetical protein